MKLHRIAAVASRHLYIIRHSPIRLLEQIYWPILDLLLWGFVSLNMEQMMAAKLGAGGHVAGFLVATFLGANILWDLMFRAQQGVSIAYLEEVWARNLLNLFVSPLTPGEFLAATMLTSLVKLAISLSVSIAVAYLAYAFNFFHIGPGLVPFMAMLLLFGWIIGVVTTALVLRFGQGAESLAWVVAFAFQPLACVFYPVSVLPWWFQPVALATPASHVFEGMRAVLKGGEMPWNSLGWALGLNVLYGILAIWFFHATFNYVREKGLLAKVGE